jgi:hypothetical protein
MTQTITFGFLGEGSRDYGFILPVAERQIQGLLPAYDVQPIPYNQSHVPSNLPLDERILAYARLGEGLHFLLYHLDADHSDTTSAYENRFSPGLQRVEAAQQGVNRQIIPVIPIRNSEAWMLADYDAFKIVTATKVHAIKLGFPDVPHQVESLSNPKQAFENALRDARPGSRRKLLADEVCPALASEIDLSILAGIPAYQAFLERLQNTLSELHLLD